MTPRQVISKAGLRAGETLHGGRAFRGRVTALSRRRGPHWQAPGERGEGVGGLDGAPRRCHSTRVGGWWQPSGRRVRRVTGVTGTSRTACLWPSRFAWSGCFNQKLRFLRFEFYHSSCVWQLFSLPVFPAISHSVAYSAAYALQKQLLYHESRE